MFLPLLGMPADAPTLPPAPARVVTQLPVDLFRRRREVNATDSHSGHSATRVNDGSQS